MEHHYLVAPQSEAGIRTSQVVAELDFEGIRGEQLDYRAHLASA
jgi:hypothetical protein